MPASRREFDQMRRELLALRQRVANMPVRPALQRGGGVLRHYRTTGATKDGANKRWTYTGVRVVKATAGYGGWTDHPSDTASYTLYSDNEDQNGSSGTYGNGVSQSNLDSVGGTFDLQPIPTGARVTAMRVEVDDSAGTVEWWIVNLPNGVDGECP